MRGVSRAGRGGTVIVLSLAPYRHGDDRVTSFDTTVIRAPSIVSTPRKFLELADLTRRHSAGRFYEARPDGRASGDGAPLFRLVRQLRVSPADLAETADDGSVPGEDDVYEFVRTGSWPEHAAEVRHDDARGETPPAPMPSPF